MTARAPVRAPALAAGAALAAMLFASRLPVTLDFILPRRAGWALFALGFELLSRPGPRGVFTTVVSLLLLGAAGRFLQLAAAAARGHKWSARAFLARGVRQFVTPQCGQIHAHAAKHAKGAVKTIARVAFGYVEEKTLFTLAGDWFPLLGALLVLAALIATQRPNFNPSKRPKAALPSKSGSLQ